MGWRPVLLQPHLTAQQQVVLVWRRARTSLFGPRQRGLLASRHPGGSNTSFCDGSVKFIKSTVNIPTWNALGTRNGGEVTTSDSY